MSALQPVSGEQRVEVIDALRGVALFGVFLVNICGFCGAGVMATATQLEALPTRAIDQVVEQIVAILFEDKANTLFAFLFGLGFYLQMQRAEAREVDFAPTYRRRLTVLLCFGVAHILFLWTWEILHLYALLGFALLATRRLSSRALLITGVALTLFDWRIPQEFVHYYGLDNWHGLGSVYSDAAVFERQAVAASGDYVRIVTVMARFTFIDYVLTGALFAWLLYAFGRFAMGAWVGRHGWLQDSARYHVGFKRTMLVCLPLGLALTLSQRALFAAVESGDLSIAFPNTLLTAIHALAVPTLAAGYACAIVVAMNTGVGRRVFRTFAFGGRMALTNYVAQSFVYGFVLFGVGPGLALAGKIGTAVAATIAIVGYALQLLISRWWLARYRFGPLEWLWRGLTYRRWPPLRRDALTSTQ